MGSVLRLPIAAGLTTHQAFTLMRKSGVRTIAAIPRGGQDPDAIDWRGKTGLLPDREKRSEWSRSTRCEAALEQLLATARGNRWDIIARRDALPHEAQHL